MRTRLAVRTRRREFLAKEKGKEERKREEAESLAVGVPEVGTRFVAPRLRRLAFLAFVFGDLFLGIGKGLTGGEHGIGASRLLLFLAQGAEFVADLTERSVNRFHLDKEVADLFQEIVKVIGTNHIGEARALELNDVLASARFWNQKKGADASALLRGDGSEFPEGDKSWPVDTRQGHVCND